MFTVRPPIAHSFLDVEGPWGILLQLALFGLLFLHVAALVVLSERPWPRRRKLMWSLAVFIPLVGPVVALRAAHQAPGPSHDVDRPRAP